MNIMQLRCFLSVAEYLSFSRAAEQLNMTQPSITHQISALEDELGSKLFVRTTRIVRLTNAGLIFQEDAKRMVELSYLAINRLHSISDWAEEFCVGLHTNRELPMLDSAFKALRKSFPQIRCNIKRDSSKSLRNLLETGEIQALLSFRIVEGVREPTEFIRLASCPFCAVMSPEHELAGEREVSIEQLAQADLIFYETHRNPPLIARLQTRLMQEHRQGKLTYTDDTACAVSRVRSEGGISILPAIVPIKETDLCYVPISNAESAEYGIYYNDLKSHSPLSLFVSEMLQLFDSVYMHIN